METQNKSKGRIVYKHDIEFNWLKAVNFIPLVGEPIVYDAETESDPLPQGRTIRYTRPRLKIGDGVTKINDLPFVVDQREFDKYLLKSDAVGKKTPEGGETFNHNANIASATNAHAEGANTTAAGGSSHAEGYGSQALGPYTHAEGNTTKAYGQYSHTEGWATVAKGESSDSQANGAHAEGRETQALNHQAHAEGYKTIASGANSHAEGNQAKAKSVADHAEGTNTIAEGSSSHAEGNGTLAHGWNSHAEGYQTQANKQHTHAEGYGAVADGDASHAEGHHGTSTGNYSHAEGYYTKSIGVSSHAEGNITIAEGSSAHAEGYNTRALGASSHAEGEKTFARAKISHVEGYLSSADGPFSHAEGIQAQTKACSAHAEGGRVRNTSQNLRRGGSTIAYSPASHAEGTSTRAGDPNVNQASETASEFLLGVGAHAEGGYTWARGDYSHAEGFGNLAEISGLTLFSTNDGLVVDDKTLTGTLSENNNFIHVDDLLILQETTSGKTNRYYDIIVTKVEGVSIEFLGEIDTEVTYNVVGRAECNIASGFASHAGGMGTKAIADAQTVIGRYNTANADALFIVGNGTPDNPSNAFEVLSDSSEPAIKIGNIVLTESKLEKLIKFIDSIEEVLE